jgi:uncharacterized membrane protein YphA (DoxX/SURF4 family)
MLKRLIQTDHDSTLTISRLVLGIIFFAHGSQLMLGWFGGTVWQARCNFLRANWEYPQSSPFWPLQASFSAGSC